MSPSAKEPVEIIFRFQDKTEYNLRFFFEPRKLMELRSKIETLIRLSTQAPQLLSGVSSAIETLFGVR